MMTRTAIHPLKILAAVGVAFVLWGLVLAGPAWAETFTVDNINDTQSNASCTSGSSGNCTLREAIDDADHFNRTADTINFDSRLKGQTIRLDSPLPTITFDSSGLTIDGVTPAGESADIKISGNHAGRVFEVDTLKPLTLNKLTITDGTANSFSDGGAILNRGKLTVSNSTISGNSATNLGGGIYNDSLGTLTVTNSTISGNSATAGGGIYNALGKLTVNDSIVSGNKAARVSGGDGFGEGGGIEILGGTAEVNNSTISNNNGSSGGGIDASGTVTVSNSTFSGNSVGAIINFDTLTVNNSTFSGHSGVNAEAIENFRGTLTISNSTLSGNSVGIRNLEGDDLFPAGLATLENTIVANSEGNNCTGPITDGGYNLDSGTTCGFEKTDPTKHSLSSTDPKLDPLANYGGPTMTMALQDDSPAIDAGAPVAADANGLSCPPPSTDQRGVSRPQGSACDIGAFERDQPPSVKIDQASDQDDPTSTSPIHFTAVFNEPVTGFEATDVTLGGSAGATEAVVSEKAPKNGTTYDVAVSGMNRDGDVTASIPADAALDKDQNGNSASTSTDNTVTFGVSKIATTTTIDSISPEPSFVGQEVTIKYSVVPTSGSGTPTGNVTVSDGGQSCTATVAAGQCTITFSSAGNKSLTATYAPDSTFSASTSEPKLHAVNMAATTTTIDSDNPDPSSVRQAVTVDYTVNVQEPGAGTPTGNVFVSDGVDSCTATVAAGSCDITLTTGGERTLTATYVSDGNFGGSTSAGESHTVDATAPKVTINKASGQDDPTSKSPIHFIVEFDESVSGFDNSDVTLDGTANADTAVVTETSNNGTTYDVAVSGMTGDGDVTASIPANAAQDEAGNGNEASTSTDNTVTYNFNGAPTATVTNGQCSTTNTASGTVNLTLNDPNGDPMTLTRVSNSNTTLVPDNNIQIGGSGNNRTVTVTVAPRKNGTATLTFNLSDGTATVPVVITVKVGSDKNETLTGTTGTDMIFGLGGKNTISGNDGNDLLCGGNANDTINGGGGNDIIDGANGNDVLRGDAGDDILRGSVGDDTLTGGADADSFSGGTGTDTATDFSPSQGDTKDNTIP